MTPLFRKFLPFLFFLLILLLMELGARVTVFLLDLELDIVVVHPNLGQAELKKQIYANDRYLLWKMKPDLDGRFVSPAFVPEGREAPVFQVRTNTRGFRGPDFPENKPDRVLRVICMGNSSTFGWGVPVDSCYTGLLGGMLEEHLDQKVEVINAGVPGYTSVQALLLLEKEILDLSPDLITLSCGANDNHPASRSDTELIREREGFIGGMQEFLANFELYRLLRFLVISLKVKTGEDSPAGGPAVRRRVKPAEFQATVKQIIARAKDAGPACVLVEILPEEEGWDPYRLSLRRISLETGVPLLETGLLFGNFLESPDSAGGLKKAIIEATKSRYGEEVLARHPGMFLRLDRVHPTSLGHLLIAEALADTRLHTLRNG